MPLLELNPTPAAEHLTIPKIIHFVVPNEPSADQLAIIDQAAAVHPDWSIKIWNDDSEFPELPLNNYLRATKSGAQFADLLRLMAVYLNGGIYVDSDMRVLRKLEPLLETMTCFIASEDGYNLTNACFGATPRHPALGSIIDFLTRNKPDWDLPCNVTTGPGLFGKLLRWRSDICILPRETFYPYHHYHAVKKTHALSYCEHLWAGSWLAGWTWTEFGYDKVPQQKSTKAAEVRSWLWKWAGHCLRPLADGVGRAVARNVPKPLSCYTIGSKVVVSSIHGHQIVANGFDYSLTPRLARDGYFELASERFVAKFLQGGDWFIDVGANIGLFSLLAAGRCGPFGRVFAFEPNPIVAELLKESAVLNWYHDRIVVKQSALSDKPGSMQLQVPRARLGDARIVKDAHAAKAERDDAFTRTRQFLGDDMLLDVDVETLDEAFPIDLPIKILKIDAEGHEAQVLAGARRLLSAKAFDYIMIEAIIDVGVCEWEQTQAGLREIMDCGYRVCTPDDDGNLVPHPTLSVALCRMKENNLIFEAIRS
jgi:FkbM family methyltransferase